MVRRRVEMKKIENKSSRQVAFSKRRKGLLKKARDLSVLCDADVAVIVFSHRGGLYDFCSAESFAGLLERYGEWIEAQNTKNTCEAENETSRVASIQKCVELLQILDRQSLQDFLFYETLHRLVNNARPNLFRNLEEQRIDKMSVTELIQLEKQLDVARKETISRKTRLQLQSIEALCEKEMKLLEEKKMLRKEVAEITDKEGRGLEETSQKDCRLDPEGKLMTLNLFR